MCNLWPKSLFTRLAAPPADDTPQRTWGQFFRMLLCGVWGSLFMWCFRPHGNDSFDRALSGKLYSAGKQDVGSASMRFSKSAQPEVQLGPAAAGKRPASTSSPRAPGAAMDAPGVVVHMETRAAATTLLPPGIDPAQLNEAALRSILRAQVRACEPAARGQALAADALCCAALFAIGGGRRMRCAEVPSRGASGRLPNYRDHGMAACMHRTGRFLNACLYMHPCLPLPACDA